MAAASGNVITITPNASDAVLFHIVTRLPHIHPSLPKLPHNPERRVIPALRDHKASADLPVLMVHPDPKENQDQAVHRVPQDLREAVVQWAQLAHLVYKDPPAPQDPPAQRETKVTQESKALREFVDHQVRREPREKKETVAYQVWME
jgi:hypothetical protein